MYLKNLCKYIFVLGLLLILIGVLYSKQDMLEDLYKNQVYKDSDYVVKNKNEYYRDYNFVYVKNVNSLIARKKRDIRDILYTGINTGATSFDFKCSTDYKNCLKDENNVHSNIFELKILYLYQIYLLNF